MLARTEAIRTAYESGYQTAMDEIADLIENQATLPEIRNYVNTRKSRE